MKYHITFPREIDNKLNTVKIFFKIIITILQNYLVIIVNTSILIIGEKYVKLSFWKKKQNKVKTFRTFRTSRDVLPYKWIILIIAEKYVKLSFGKKKKNKVKSFRTFRTKSWRSINWAFVDSIFKSIIAAGMYCHINGQFWLSLDNLPLTPRYRIIIEVMILGRKPD